MVRKDKILNYFYILKKNNCIGASYLFIGEDFSLVKDIIKLINCREDSRFCNTCWDCQRIKQGNHPDLFLIDPEGLTIKIDAIREGIRFFSLKGFRLKNKVVVIKNAQNLGQEAANAFLKTLEEPPENSFIAICSSKTEGLLPTIVSRCRKIFLPFNDRENDKFKFHLVSEFLKGEKIEFKDRKKFSLFLWSLIMFLRNNLISKTVRLNNQLFQESESETILGPKSIGQIHNALKHVLEIYGVCNNINIKLALNLIRMKFFNADTRKFSVDYADNFKVVGER